MLQVRGAFGVSQGIHNIGGLILDSEWNSSSIFTAETYSIIKSIQLIQEYNIPIQTSTQTHSMPLTA